MIPWAKMVRHIEVMERKAHGFEQKLSMLGLSGPAPLSVASKPKKKGGGHSVSSEHLMSIKKHLATA